MMAVLFGSLTLGVLAGRIPHWNPTAEKIAQTLTRVFLFGLLFIMGLGLGADKQLIALVPQLGVQALVIALFGIVGSVSLVRLGSYLARLPEAAAAADYHRPGGATVGVFPLFTVACVALGVLAGYFLPVLSLLAGYGTYVLVMLLFAVGRDLGRSPDFSVRQLVSVPRLLVVPIAAAVGTMLAAVLVGFCLPYPLRSILGVAAGFGWYSLAGGLTTTLAGPELGALSFLANVARELLTVLALPFISRWFGAYAAAAAGGATAMDTTLPFIVDAAGPEAAPPAFVSGVVLSLAVPLLLPLILG
jgi:uncharacterized membrane protein YbjE (DUF340 family)